MSLEEIEQGIGAGLVGRHRAPIVVAPEVGIPLAAADVDIATTGVVGATLVETGAALLSGDPTLAPEDPEEAVFGDASVADAASAGAAAASDDLALRRLQVLQPMVPRPVASSRRFCEERGTLGRMRSCGMREVGAMILHRITCPQAGI